MALRHASQGAPIDVRPLDKALSNSPSVTLMRSDHLEMVRLVLPVGKRIREHRAPGEIIMQCREDAIRFGMEPGTKLMRGGDMLILAGDEPHWLKAEENASLFVMLFQAMAREQTNDQRGRAAGNGRS